MKIQLFVAIILSTFSFMACEQESQVPDDQQNLKSLDGIVVKYGTSFGMCLGPCKKEMVLANDEVAFTVYQNSGRGTEGGDPKTYTEKLTTDYISEVNKNVDFDAFKKLDEVIGCPDCADGGAEWVEITKNDSRHKVTFEFGDDIKEIAPLLKLLREKRIYFEEKYVKP
ncbi:hypothetical protein [Emticicia sp. BO119]|uniref:hypothetical protein n=1 Tax=Emticicia sp. BO119 TaxID=2757768 RepID=UPI0015F0796C|nr:hypothetical protein [Emticicia sp. BO119]MBA4850017.1 hypothetical protein [Emticicia sp. BO119]